MSFGGLPLPPTRLVSPRGTENTLVQNKTKEHFLQCSQECGGSWCKHFVTLCDKQGFRRSRIDGMDQIRHRNPRHRGRGRRACNALCCRRNKTMLARVRDDRLKYGRAIKHRCSTCTPAPGSPTSITRQSSGARAAPREAGHEGHDRRAHASALARRRGAAVVRNTPCFNNQR